QWLDISTFNQYFIYDVCDTTGKASALYINGEGAKCAVYSGGGMNITISTEGITAALTPSSTLQSIDVVGKSSPYFIHPTTKPAPECNLPYPTAYQDQRWRMVNLDGATLETPQFPYKCDLLYFANLGVNTVVLPFKWDYLQNFLGQDIPIDWSDGGYGAQIIKLANAWTQKNYIVILSMYNHMRYSYCSIGTSDCWVSKERYANAWAQIAQQFYNNSHVIFDLMNDPNVDDIVAGINNGTNVVLNNQNAAAKAIRAAGAVSQKILYSGNSYSSTQSWFNDDQGASNADLFTTNNIIDNNYLLSISMFYDHSGIFPENGCIASASQNSNDCIVIQHADAFVTWLNSTKSQSIIKKTGGTNSSSCIICINTGTTWMLLEKYIVGIGLWVAGHGYVNIYDESLSPLYLAPTYNQSQIQMSAGFLNVSNPQSGEKFLISPQSDSSHTPTIQPTDKQHSEEAFLYTDIIHSLILIAAGSTIICTVLMLYGFLSQRENNKYACSVFSLFHPKHRDSSEENLLPPNLHSQQELHLGQAFK
ncbi:MAG: glycoside hydrolase family 5 protein, partial [Gammaproteobacteria bacterium]|nr:glycoside hydrolase family 5 protein [Gammaproteobacteria bacterium]